MKVWEFIGLAAFVGLLAFVALVGCSRPEEQPVPVASTATVAQLPPQVVDPEPSGVPENRKDWVRPAISGSAESDCSGVLEMPTDPRGRSWVRKGSAALGYKLGERFVPMFYFTSVRSAQDCARGNPDAVVKTWNGHEWN